jgi:hypothetical protein
MKFNMAWGRKVDSAFAQKVISIARDFEWTSSQVNALMACMAFESAETFSPSIKNGAGSGATGLIQFMPMTAEGLGTDTKTLAKMTAVDQLNYVRRYFAPYYRRIKTLEDMYMAILMPKYIGAPKSTIVFTKGGVSYDQNKGLDANKDSVVTIEECAGKVSEKLVLGLSQRWMNEQDL